MRSTTIFVAVFLLTSLSAQKKFSDSTYEKALAYYEQKNFDACIIAIKPAIKDADEKPDLRILAAHCHTGKKNYAEAIYHLRAVAENFPDRDGIKSDIVALLFAQGKYREARKSGYKFIEEFKDSTKTVPESLSLWTAHACLAYGKASEALSLARDAKQSADTNIKYQGLITETRALIAQANFSEADIALSFAESMRDSELHVLLRANIAELIWATQKFPEDKRAEIVALYEKISHSNNSEIRTAAQKNLERVVNSKKS